LQLKCFVFICSRNILNCCEKETQQSGFPHVDWMFWLKIWKYSKCGYFYEKLGGNFRNWL